MCSRLIKKGRNVVDSWLDNIGLYRKNVAFDETCLFRAVSEQIFGCQVHHERVRKECIDHAKMNWSQFAMHFDTVEGYFDHLEMLEKHMVLCGNVELEIISYTYNRDIIIYNAAHHTAINITNRNLEKRLRLCLIDDHYDVIYDKEQIETAGFCQSIVYKVLYEEVFKISNVDHIVNGMLYGKNKIITQAQVMAEKKMFGDCLGSSTENSSMEDLSCDYEASESGEAVSVAPFPFKVAKALDPTIYRNIEFDSWGEMRREMRLGEWYHGDEKLTLGTKCNWHLNGEDYECYIQEIFRESNECMVYLTKLAERRIVNYNSLSPETDAKPWPLPYRFSKNLVINNSTNEKFLRSPKKQFLKDKRRTKSCSEGAAALRPLDLSEKIDNVHLFVGNPLQIRGPSDDNSKNELLPNPCENLDLLGAAEASSANSELFNCEQPQWHYMPPTPEPYFWPPTPTTPQSMFNYNIRPMIASAPVTPDVVPYHHNQNYPYYYNCPVEPVNNSMYWSNQVTPDCYMSPPPDYRPQDASSNCVQSKSTTVVSESQQTVNEVDFSQITSTQPNISPVVSPSYATSTNTSTTERPTLCTNLTPQSPIDMFPPHYPPYSPIIPMSATTPQPIIQYSSQLPDIVVPQAPYTVYTPTMDIQYVTPNPTFVYQQPTPPATWYPAGINSQGFIFPTPATAQNIPHSNK